MLPLGEEAIAWLKEYLARSRPYLLRSSEQTLLFLTYRGNRLARSELARIVSAIARRTGVKKAVTPHVLRHSCATHMLRHGAGLRQLQELMGHLCCELSRNGITVRRAKPRSIKGRNGAVTPFPAAGAKSRNITNGSRA